MEDHHHDHHHDEPKSSIFEEILKHKHEHDFLSELKSIELTPILIYTCTTLAILSISVLPAALLYCIPVKNSNGQVLKFLLAFGAGGLLGDAILHIIPHAMLGHHGHHHHHDHHDHSSVGLQVIAGILIFMIFEQFTRIIRGSNCHHHHHQHELQHLNEVENSAKVEKPVEIRSSAYLNLVADFLHNATDGLAIGASFSINLYTGLLTTLTVLIHELPHEIGDFAILVQSGFTKFQAIKLQFCTALGALFGGFIAIWMSNLHDAAHSHWIMPVTAGGFIYIATVSVIPDILEMDTRHSRRQQIIYSLANVFGLISGVFMMYLVATFE